MYKYIRDLYHLAAHAQKHPLTRDAKLRAFRRFISWQTARFIGSPIIIPFISNTRLIIARSVPGSAGEYYFGAIEFEEIALTLHYLQPEDVFGDVGANIGSWTIAAAGVCGANVISIEPLPATYAVLLDNISINRVNHLVRPLAIGAGAKSEKLHLSDSSGVENHIVYDNSGTEIEILPLDNIFVKAPTALKIDVEGFEAAVILGAERLINDHNLQLIIVEDLGLARLHGLDGNIVHNKLVMAGFNTYSYEANSRMLTKSSKKVGGNSIYVRDAGFVQNRVKHGRSFTILNRIF